MFKKTESERRHDEPFSEANEIVYTLDLAGNFTFVNQAGERISGYSCEEVCRMNVAEVLAPEFAEHVRKYLTRKCRERFGSVFEIDITAKDGRRIALEASTRLVIRDGRPIEFRGIAMPSILRSQSPTHSRPLYLDPGFFFRGVPHRLQFKYLA